MAVRFERIANPYSNFWRIANPPKHRPLFAGTFEYGRIVLAVALHDPVRAGAVGGDGGVHRVGGDLPRYAAFHLGYIAAAGIKTQLACVSVSQ